MKLRLRCTVAAALMVYSTVNVVVGAAHHHGTEPGGWISAAASDPNLATQEPADDEHDDDDEDEACLICNVLHLAQKPPAVFQVEVTSVLTGIAVFAAPIIRSYPLQSNAHSRAPPLS
jgi:hypothetical protein